MNVLSLFSGIGGLDLGLERAGMTIAGQVEIDPWCRKVLAKHWPEVPRHDDARTCAEWWGDRPVDLVCGGFPCQPVSLAGKGLAQADSRWLWPAFSGVIRDLAPRYVLVENVPGLLGRGMGDVLGDLAAIGYDAEWDSIPAAFVGAPHIRNRVWILAYPAGVGLVGADDSQREHAAEGRAGRPAADNDRLAGEAGSQPAVLAYPARSGRDDSRLHRSRTRSRDDTGTPLAGEPGGGRGTVANTERDGLERPRQSALSRQGAAVLRRRPPEPGRWAPEPDVGRVAHGIPARVDRLRGLGNAVVPQVAEHIGRLIMSHQAVTS